MLRLIDSGLMSVQPSSRRRTDYSAQADIPSINTIQYFLHQRYKPKRCMLIRAVSQ